MGIKIPIIGLWSNGTLSVVPNLMGDLGYQTGNKAMQLLARKSGGIGSLETIVNGQSYGTKNTLQTSPCNNSSGL